MRTAAARQAKYFSTLKQGWAKWKTHDTHDILRNEISIVSLDKTHSAELYRKYRKKTQKLQNYAQNIENCIETHFRYKFRS